MFKSATIFKITKLPVIMALREIDAMALLFTPLSGSQEKSTGWAPARNQDHGALVETVGGNDIMRFMSESKSVPSATINEKAKERAKQIETLFGRKPVKKELREIKDDIKIELLPHAFPRQSATMVWLDYQNMRLVIDTASQSRSDEVVTLLVKTFDGLAVGLLETNTSPTAAMSGWLLSNEDIQLQRGFDIGRSCRLEAADESKAVVSYNRHTLDSDEIRQHIQQGKLPTALALTYDDRVSFVLTAAGGITKMKFLDVVFEGTKDADSGFDADVAILTGELTKLIPDLLDALGGEVVAS